MTEADLFIRLVARLRSSGAFKYDVWSDGAGGSYSIEGVAHMVMGLLEECGVLPKSGDDELAVQPASEED